MRDSKMAFVSVVLEKPRVLGLGLLSKLFRWSLNGSYVRDTVPQVSGRTVPPSLP